MGMLSYFLYYSTSIVVFCGPMAGRFFLYVDAPPSCTEVCASIRVLTSTCITSYSLTTLVPFALVSLWYAWVIVLVRVDLCFFVLLPDERNNM